MSSRLPIETGSQCRGSFLGPNMPSGMSLLSQKAGLCRCSHAALLSRALDFSKAGPSFLWQAQMQ
eukprot:14383227-Heterocapsa_arctica.AAC.1